MGTAHSGMTEVIDHRCIMEPEKLFGVMERGIAKLLVLAIEGCISEGC